MGFFPKFILKRNRFRGTPHWSIALATGIPITVLLLVRGEITILGDMRALIIEVAQFAFDFMTAEETFPG